MINIVIDRNCSYKLENKDVVSVCNNILNRRIRLNIVSADQAGHFSADIIKGRY
ncbi:MAG: hypothetical protein ABJB76_02125 [Candidatus Nitrosocosmicus sp.]